MRLRRVARRSLLRLVGDAITTTLDYDGGRRVTAHVPEHPIDAIVFAADGGWHGARLVDALERAGTTSVTVVAVDGMPHDEGRFSEYVPGVDDGSFAAHESFFVDDVPTWLEFALGLELTSQSTAVWGASLGGEFALAMGMRHPDVFGAVFSASPGGGYRPPAAFPSAIPAVYLVAGGDEPFFAENARRWLEALRGASSDVVMHVRDGDHGGAFWYEELPLMVAWAFRGD
jgi:enterochelin esterase-like enzyme